MSLKDAAERGRPDARASWSWRLFEDWSTSWGREAMPASRDALIEFLDAFPASRSTQVKRVAVILAVHTEAGLSIHAPRLRRLPDSLWAARPGLLDPIGALAQLPRYRFPVGLVGRRDGFLIVLTGILGLSREQARQIRPDAIDVDSRTIRILGRDVPVRERAQECPRCVVASWLNVIAPHYERLRGSYLPLLDPTTADPDDHACESDVGSLWRTGVALLPSIDAMGVVGTGGPLSTRAITEIIRRRRIPTGAIEKVGRVIRSGGRYEAASSGELAAAQDQVLDQVNDVNRYLEELLAEAASLKDTLGMAGTGPD